MRKAKEHDPPGEGMIHDAISNGLTIKLKMIAVNQKMFVL